MLLNIFESVYSSIIVFIGNSFYLIFIKDERINVVMNSAKYFDEVDLHILMKFLFFLNKACALSSITLIEKF